MDKILWNEKYSVQIPSIDEQHKKFIDLINRLNFDLDAAENLEKKTTLLKLLLTEFEDYALYHFIYEEEHFIMYDYSGAKDHIAAHDGFRAKIAEFIEETTVPGADVVHISKELSDYALNWLEVHLDKMDKGYIECFKSHKME